MTRSVRNPEPDQGTKKPTAIEFRSVSKWYGHVIGVNNLSLRVAAGVTGLLGPNGARFGCWGIGPGTTLD
ncbi:MAG: hypothetical protein ACXVCF_07390 [Isosphaeraceae bacterium]